MSHCAAQTLSVYLYPRPASVTSCRVTLCGEVQAGGRGGGCFGKEPDRDSSREEAEGERGECWQFHSDHLNVQTIRALIPQMTRCVCAADQSRVSFYGYVYSEKVHVSSRQHLDGSSY